MHRLLILLICLALAGCAAKTGDSIEATSTVISKESRHAEVRLVRPEGAVLDALSKDYAVRDFSFRGGSSPRLRATVVNARAEGDLSFDVAALFLAADGTETDRKAWQRVTIAPGKRHFFLATTQRSDSVNAELLIKPAGTP